MQLVTIAGDPQPLAGLPPGNGHILMASVEHETAVNTAAALIRWFRDRALGTPPDGPVIVLALVDMPDQDMPHTSATIAALRGIVQSVTRECADWPPINLVAVTSARITDAAAALAYLTGPGGAFTAGATIDLTEQP